MLLKGFYSALPGISPSFLSLSRSFARVHVDFEFHLIQLVANQVGRPAIGLPIGRPHSTAERLFTDTPARLATVAWGSPKTRSR